MSMARRSSGLRTVIRVAKAFDRAAKQAERDRLRRIREAERDEKARKREEQRRVKALEKAEKDRVKAEAKAAAQALIDELSEAKRLYERRVKERQLAKKKAISTFMR
jgi:hypothetical protein